jgi:hypothetical protein
MPSEKTAPTETVTAPKKAEGLLITEWWKPQTAALQALCGEALTLTEARLRKQADLLHALAGAKDFTDALKVQTSFVQEFWADATRDATRAFSTLRRASGAEA